MLPSDASHLILFKPGIWLKTRYHLISSQAFSIPCIWTFFFLISWPNICFVYSKEPSQWGGYFEHPKHMLKLMGKKYLNFTLKNFVYVSSIWHGSHLGSWNRKILTMLKLHIGYQKQRDFSNSISQCCPKTPTEFLLHQTNCLFRHIIWRIYKWPPWSQSWISERDNF